MFQVHYDTPTGEATLTVLGANLPASPAASDVVLGRESSCEVSLHERSVSRRHARIFREGGSWHVEDLDSRNPIYLSTLYTITSTEPWVGSGLRSKSRLKLVGSPCTPRCV